MNKGVFITGTDTDIGKTYVTALVVKYLRDQGINAGYYKAAMSGVVEGQENDAQHVCRIASLPDEDSQLVSYQYREAVSPHLAAVRCNNTIYPDVILKDFQTVSSRYDYTVVEGSGGIVCPLNMECDPPLMLTDVVKLLFLGVIIVADAGLGTINHVCLTVEYLQQKHIPIYGILLNRYDPNSFMHVDNRKQISRLTGCKILACVKTGAKNIEFDLSHIL